MNLGVDGLGVTPASTPTHGWEVANVPDEIIEELWRIKDNIAREHGNKVRKLAAYLRDGKRRERCGSPRRSVVDVLDESTRPTPLQERQ